MRIESSKPRKQRLFFYSMPLHISQKSLAANVSKGLRKSIGKRSLSIRKGDKVKVMRGSHKDFEGKVARTDYDKQQVFLEKLVRKKNDGTEKGIPLHASNLMIIEVDKSDARRIGKGKTSSEERKGKDARKTTKTDGKEVKTQEDKSMGKQKKKETDKKEKTQKKSNTTKQKERTKNAKKENKKEKAKKGKKQK